MASAARAHKIICGGCGERVREDACREAYRASDQSGEMCFVVGPTPGSTLTYLCANCYDEWQLNDTESARRQDDAEH